VLLNDLTSSLDASSLLSGTLSLGSVSGIGSVSLGNKNLTVTGNGATFAGAIADGGNGGSITKTGTGRWTLSGSSSYTGTTTVAQGTLIVTGSLSSASAIRVGDSATSGTAIFGGSGNVGNVNIGSTASGGAILSPDVDSFGGSTGTTLTTGALVFASGSSTLLLEIGRTTAGADVSSHVRASSIDLSAGGNLQLSLLNTDHPITNGDLFFLIISGNPITGNFTSLNGTAASLIEGATLTLSGQEYEITYQASFSNQLFQFPGGQDVALLAIPEPSIGAILLAGVVLLGGFQRLRRRETDTDGKSIGL